MNEKTSKIFRRFAKASGLSASGYNFLRAQYDLASAAMKEKIKGELELYCKKAALRDSPLNPFTQGPNKIIAP